MPYLSFGIAACLMIMSLVIFFQKPQPGASHKATKSSTKRATSQKKAWKSALEREFNQIERLYPNQLGIYIKDLKTGEEFSRRSNELWYLSSGIKIPIAFETLKQIDAGRFSLHQQVELQEDDFVDGPGSTNFSKPGTDFSVEHLIEQMLVRSDNTASDVLLRLIGIDKVNEFTQLISPLGFTKITSLKDIRRHVYSELHPKAVTLTGRDFIQLKNIPQMGKKLEKFAEILNLDRAQIRLPHVHNAFMEYYKKNLNSSTLKAYAMMLEHIIEDRVLTESSKSFLIDTLTQTESGKNRIKGGLSKSLVFAHKAGTQYMRVSDYGFLWNKNALNEKPVIIVVCTKNFQTVDIAERILKRVGIAVQSAGLV